MISAHGESDVGRRRATNEDVVLVDGDLLVVADGLGGHNAGEVASRLAVDTIHAVARGEPGTDDLTRPWGRDPALPAPADRLRVAIKAANLAVYRRAIEDPACADMGTTVVVTVCPPPANRLHYAHVGDSRLYLLRASDRGLRQLTQDHSWGARGYPLQRHVLTRALGTEPDVAVDIGEAMLEEGDLVLLCSDGLTTMVDDHRIAVLCREGGELPALCRALVEEANARGGRDNVSVVLARWRRDGRAA